MSLINQVLKDIDKREQQERSEARAVPGLSQTQPAKPAWVFLLLGTLGSILVLLVALIVWRTLTMTSEPNEIDLPVVQQETSVVQQQEVPVEEPQPLPRAEPIHASQMYPVAQGVPEPVVPVEQEPANKAVDASVDAADDKENTAVETAEQPPEPVSEQPAGQMRIERTQVSAQQLAEQRFQQAMQALQQGDAQAGAKGLQEALVLMPSYHEAREQLAVYYFSQGFLSDALNVLEQGLEQFPQTARLMLLQARMLERAEQKDMALRLLERVENRLPEHADLLILRGALAQELGQFELARSTYQVLTAWRPSEGRWWLGLAMAEEELAQLSAAAEAYRNALTDPSLSVATRNFIHQQIEGVLP